MQCLSNVTETPLQAAPVVALPSAQRGGLGNNAKSTSAPAFLAPLPFDDRAKQRLARAERYYLLAVARDLLIAEGVKQGLEHGANFARTAKCMHVRRSSTVSVHKSIRHQSAFYSGLITCGSVWACPICAAKIQERRRLELARAIDWAWNNGYQPIMVTLTAPHRRDQSLTALRDMQQAALADLRSGRGGKSMREKLGHEGLIRSLEVTNGVNGWHLHVHEMWFVRKDVDARAARVIIRKRWLRSCLKAGLITLDRGSKRSILSQLRPFFRHSVDVKGNCSASDYLAKMDSPSHWGADREMAKASSKQGKKSGLHPFGLLAEAAKGCTRSGRLFVEYAIAMKGKAQLFWSRGLKDRVGVDEITDEELAEKSEDDAILLGELDRKQWELILRSKARAQLLDAAELGGWEAVLELLNTLTKQPSPAATVSYPDTRQPDHEQSATDGEPVSAPAPVFVPDHPVPEPQQPGQSIVWLSGVSWYVDLDSGELGSRVERDHDCDSIYQSRVLMPEPLLPAPQ